MGFLTLRCSIIRPHLLFKTLPSLKLRQYSSSNNLNVVIEALKFGSDHGPVMNFLTNVFRVSEPITRTLNCTPSDTAQLFEDIYTKCSQLNLSLVAKDDTGRFGAIVLNSLCEIGDEQQKNNEHIVHLLEKKEFGEEIRNGPYPSVNANRIHVLLNLIEANIACLPPSTFRKAIKLDIMSVDPEFFRLGLGSKMLLDTIQLARSSGCSHVLSPATAVASQTGLRKFGFSAVKKLKYDSFLDNGKPIFSGVHDGGDGAELLALAV